MSPKPIRRKRVATPDYPAALAAKLAGELRAVKRDLVRRWLERIEARVTLTANEVFPTESLLNHVPLLIDGIASYLESEETSLAADNAVAAKAMELGELRHEQGFDVYEILKELEILGAILFSFLQGLVDANRIKGNKRDFLICWQRVAHAIELIRQATVTRFLRLAAEQVNEREERLRRFNRMVSHELKNHVSAIRGAAHLLGEEWLSPNELMRFRRMVLDNSEELERVLSNLELLSRIETDARKSRNVLLPQAVAEVVRQLREMAQRKKIAVEVAEPLPPVEVDAAAVELCLVNYLSNSIKYSDPKKKRRYVKIDGSLDYSSKDGGQLVVVVTDNGVGVPHQLRRNLFTRFYRAHAKTITGTEGSGLGLSIVRETAESLGGRAWAEFPETGETVFAFSLPSRRLEDAASAGTKRIEDKL
jgi:signal transduction histidine kinase